MKVVRIDENTVNALKADKGGEPPKVINLGKSLLTAISEEANPARVKEFETLRSEV